MAEPISPRDVPKSVSHGERVDKVETPFEQLLLDQASVSWLESHCFTTRGPKPHLRISQGEIFKREDLSKFIL
jgi:hypothetical protein